MIIKYHNPKRIRKYIVISNTSAYLTSTEHLSVHIPNDTKQIIVDQTPDETSSDV